MRPTSVIDQRDIAAFEGIDQREMFPNGDLIPSAFIPLVPLIVIVEDHGDHVLEAFDKAVWRDSHNQAMEPAVQFREILKPGIDVREQFQMRRSYCTHLLPDG